MHVDEIDISEDLVRQLLEEQFPKWAKLPLHRVERQGTVHAIFRLGDELAVRLPRRDGPTVPGSRQLDWLPRLAPTLPLEIPVALAQGEPTRSYPWFWEIHTWVHGASLPMDAIDPLEAARDLAGFVAALQSAPSEGAPPGRGIPLAERDIEMRYWFARFKGHQRVHAEWQRALAAPPWDGPPLWHHGDLDVRNWLVADRRLTGIIDWDSMGVGDPACEVMVAWKLHSAEARDAFREALSVDDATWQRAKGWALSQAVAILAYYTPANNPTLLREADSWLNLVLSESA